MTDSRQRQLAARLARLRGRHGSFDHRYLEALLQRAGPRPVAVARRLLDRVERGVAALEHQGAAGGEVNQTTPAEGETIARLRHLRQALDARPDVDPAAGRLARALESQDRQTPGRTSGDSLRAARRLESLRARYRQHRLIAVAREEQPAAPGPLNPHNLLVRALTAMGEISPAYLARLTEYSRQLLWLQQLGEKPPPAKKARGKR